MVYHDNFDVPCISITAYLLHVRRVQACHTMSYMYICLVLFIQVVTHTHSAVLCWKLVGAIAPPSPTISDIPSSSRVGARDSP